MKRIITGKNYLQLQEINDNGEYKLQKGFALAGLTYKIENKNIKFYLKDDYFYKNAVWSADIPLNIDGVEYDIDEIAEAMGKLFDPSNIGVTSINGMQGDVTLTASDVNTYNKAQVDNLIEQEATAIQTEKERALAAESALSDRINAKADASSLDNYYTKDEVYNKTESDAKYATQTVVNEEIAARIQRDSEIEQTLVSKADKSDTYSKQEVDDAIALKVDQETFDTKEEVISKALNELHNSLDNHYTKSEIDAMVGNINTILASI